MHTADRPADVVELPMRLFPYPFLKSLLLPLILIFRFERLEEQIVSQTTKGSERERYRLLMAGPLSFTPTTPR